MTICAKNGLSTKRPPSTKRPLSAKRVSTNRVSMSRCEPERRTRYLGTGDYYEEMNDSHHDKWCTEKVLPRLAQIVRLLWITLYHSLKQENVPRMSTLKKNTHDWFSIKDAAWSNDVVKVALRKLVETINVVGDT